MSDIIDAIREFLKPYYMKILIIFVIIVFSLAAVYGYNKFGKPILQTDPTKDVANASRRNKVADLYFFHVDWCPHCVKAIPVWKSFADDYNGREVNGVTVKCHSIDCTDASTKQNAEYILKYNIESYPTVKLVLGDGTVVEFDAKIDGSSLIQFVETFLADK